MTPKARRVSITEFVLLVGSVSIDIGLLLYTALRVLSHRGNEAGKPLLVLLPTLIMGGLFTIFGIHSLNETLQPSLPESGDITIESLSVSPTYTVMMLIYGSLLLLITVAGGLVVINLNLGL
jgi:hypothetical protein